MERAAEPTVKEVKTGLEASEWAPAADSADANSTAGGHDTKTAEPMKVLNLEQFGREVFSLRMIEEKRKAPDEDSRGDTELR